MSSDLNPLGMGLSILQFLLGWSEKKQSPQEAADAARLMQETITENAGANAANLESAFPSLTGLRYQRDDKGNAIGLLPSLTPLPGQRDFALWQQDPLSYSRFVWDNPDYRPGDYGASLGISSAINKGIPDYNIPPNMPPGTANSAMANSIVRRITDTNEKRKNLFGL